MTSVDLMPLSNGVAHFEVTDDLGCQSNREGSRRNRCGFAISGSPFPRHKGRISFQFVYAEIEQFVSTLQQVRPLDRWTCKTSLRPKLKLRVSFGCNAESKSWEQLGPNTA